MKYLLIVFIIFLALAPLSHFVPSKRQRKIARLREYAAVHGLFVEFRHLPGSSREGSPARASGQQIIYYGKRLPPARRRQDVGARSFAGPQKGIRFQGFQQGLAGITAAGRNADPNAGRLQRPGRGRPDGRDAGALRNAGG